MRQRDRPPLNGVGPLQAGSYQECLLDMSTSGRLSGPISMLEIAL